MVQVDKVELVDKVDMVVVLVGADLKNLRVCKFYFIGHLKMP